IVGAEGGFSLKYKYRDIIFGGPRRDELIDEVIAEIRDMARAGIPCWGYQWMPNSVWRTPPALLRGGSFGTAFEMDWVKDHPDTHDRRYTREEMWEHLEYWIKAVTPVAEEEGIRLGIHPDDPPVEELGGLPRILNSFAAYKRLTGIIDSEYNGIEFCQGTFSEMNEDIYEMVEHFASRKKILFVHFRNVTAQVPDFSEELINRGYVDMHRIAGIYRDAGYDGPFMDDHCPVLDGDTPFPGNVGGYRSRLFAQGFIQGVLEAVKKENDHGMPAVASGAAPKMSWGIGCGGVPARDVLRMGAQLGAENFVLSRPNFTVENGRWSMLDIANAKTIVESFGLKLAAIQIAPTHLYSEIMWGGANRERQIENMIHNVRMMARAGIPNYMYTWKDPRLLRTRSVPIRGGAMATAFDAEEAAQWPDIEGAGVSEEQVWANLEEWIRVITPIAEEEGIRLAIHPNDPPIPTLSGTPQIFRSFDSFKRLIEIVDSPSNAICFCQGTFSQMAAGENPDIYEMIRYFAERKKIAYVHFRNVSGQVPKFHEEFINTGYVDMYRAMRTYHQAGFDGFFIDDHVPRVWNDTEWGHRSVAFAHGYIQSLVEAVEKHAAG
ncbi:MAG: mannonate dehydratase, partial [Chloroflexi bacterium]|nr:mannonate dehydratase [Chloroflexota bacterium]